MRPARLEAFEAQTFLVILNTTQAFGRTTYLTTAGGHVALDIYNSEENLYVHVPKVLYILALF